MLHRLSPYLRRHRNGEKHEALVSLRDCMGKRVATTDCPAFRELRYDCGSCPTESLCGTLTDRLKDAGMRSDVDNAKSAMPLTGLYHTGVWITHTESQRTAA